MINGMHVIIYTADAEKDRAFFRDILKFPYVDVGQGWLIFSAPPSELACHPTESKVKHEAYLMCDDVEAQIKSIEEAGYVCQPIIDEGWGFLTRFTLPGGGNLGLYQPKHALPPR